MSDITVVFQETHWKHLLAALQEGRETAAVLLAGTAETTEALTLTVNAVLWVPDKSYEIRTETKLQITSDGWMPSLRQASDGGWLPVFFHTHPNMSAAASRWDRIVDDQLSSTFRTRVNCARYASLILGGTADRPTFAGTVIDNSSSSPITRLRVTGRRLRIQSAEDSNLPSPPLDIYDRQIRAFGPEGQQLLQNLRVGVVGCGGTGSAMLEQLTRLGVGSLAFVDYDEVTSTNITRIHGSRLADVGRPKVDVMSDYLKSIGLSTTLKPISGNVTQREVMEELRDCDVIFGCTDDDGGRGVLSRFAYWYLVPVIDMAVVISSRDGEIGGIFARLTIAAPGQPCLLCRGEFDAVRAREEQYSAAERRALVSEGYAQGLPERDPAVIAYTTMIASHAVADLLQRLFGFGPPDIPGKQLLRIADHKIRAQAGTARDGCYCTNAAKLGRADAPSALGITWAA